MGATGSKGGGSADDVLVHKLEGGDWRPLIEELRRDRRVARKPLRARNGDTALHVLGHKSCLEGVQAMLNELVASKQRDRGTPLPPEEKQRYLAKVCNVTNDRGRTPLMAAAKAGADGVVRLLLEHQANLWIRDKSGGATALHYAAAAGHESVVRTLLAWEAAHPPALAAHPTDSLLDEGNANGLTPLHYAIWHKRHRMVTTLCELGASLYAKSTWTTTGDAVPCAAGSTPLHVAAVSGSQRCTRALMKAYAARVGAAQEAVQRGEIPAVPEDLPDPRLIQDRLGNLPFSVALQHNHLRLLALLHPFTPLAQLFSDERPEDRVLGVPRLKEIAAMAAQRVLLQQLDSLEMLLSRPHHPSTFSLPTKMSGAGTAAVYGSDGMQHHGEQLSASPTGVLTPAAGMGVGGEASDNGPGSRGGTEHEDNDSPRALPGNDAATVASTAGGAVSAGVPPVLALPRQLSTRLSRDSADTPASSGVGEAGRTPASPLVRPAVPSTALTQPTEGGGVNGGGATTATSSTAAPAVDSRITPTQSAPDLLHRSGGHAGSAQLDALLAAAAATAGEDSWVHRRGAWRARLPPPARGPLRPQHSRESAGTPGTDGSASPVAGLDRTPVTPGGETGAENGRVASAATRSPAPQLSGGGAGSQWINRRSAWRQTLKRHEQQLLAGYLRQASVPAGVPGPHQGASGSGAGAGSSAWQAPTHSLGTQSCVQLCGPDGEAAGSREHHALSSHSVGSRLPPQAALSLRLLGLAGSLRPPALPRAPGDGRRGDGAAALDAPGGGPDEVHGEAGAAGDDAHSLQSQITAAIHMLRVHRLTNGVDGAVTHLEAAGTGASGVTSTTGGVACTGGSGGGGGGGGVALAAGVLHDVSEEDGQDGEGDAAAGTGGAGGAGAGGLARVTGGSGSGGDAGGGGGAAGAMCQGATVIAQLTHMHTQMQLARQNSFARGRQPSGRPGDTPPGRSTVGGTAHTPPSCPSPAPPCTVSEPGVSPGLVANGHRSSVERHDAPRTPTHECAPGCNGVPTPGGAGGDAPGSAVAGGALGTISSGGGVEGAASRPPSRPSSVRGLPQPATPPVPVAACGAASGLISGASQAQLVSMVRSLMRSAPASEVDEGEEETCGVCLDGGVFVGIKGCSHKLCVSCARELLKLHELKPCLCPFCRHLILGFVQPGPEHH